jgi:hypothetical protein
MSERRETIFSNGVAGPQDLDDGVVTTDELRSLGWRFLPVSGIWVGPRADPPIPQSEADRIWAITKELSGG